MEHQTHTAGHPHDDPPAGHGMLVVGLEATFFCERAGIMIGAHIDEAVLRPMS